MKGHWLTQPSRPLMAQGRAALEHVQRGLERALRVVLVGDRRAEDRHHRVAHELLHEAVIARDRLGQHLEQRVLERPYLFRIEPLGERGEARQIGEEDRDLTAVGLVGRAGGSLACLGSRRFDRRQRLLSGRHGLPGVATALGQGGAATRAEREVGFARKPARGTGAGESPPTARAEREAGGTLETAGGTDHRSRQSKPGAAPVLWRLVLRLFGQCLLPRRRDLEDRRRWNPGAGCHSFC